MNSQPAMTRKRLRRDEATIWEIVNADGRLLTPDDFLLFALANSTASEVEVSAPDPEPLSVRLRLRQFRGSLINAAEREALTQAVTERIPVNTQVRVEAMTE